MFGVKIRPLAALASLALAGATVAAGVVPGAESSPPPPRDPIVGQNFADSTGTFSTFTPSGRIDQTTPFFLPLGTNGRACVDCHQPKSGWTITPESAQAAFDASNGLAPLFRTVDGANSPEADVSTVAARRAAYSMLLTKGLIRVHLPIPADAEFTLVGWDDPYGHATAADLSLFRRPLPTMNFAYLSSVMWDGRQTGADGSIANDLVSQAEDAIRSHAQAVAGSTIPTTTLQAIARFETTVYSAQSFDTAAGWLDADGAQGGALNLSRQPFWPGINDPFGGDPTHRPFNPRSFTLYAGWPVSPPPPPALRGPVDPHRPPPPPPPPTNYTPQRAAISRGEEVFISKPILISGVPGLNDVSGRSQIRGTCTTCHNTPNVGSHSTPLMVNLGLADGTRRTPDMPLYTLRNTVTGLTVETTDPGQALITGKWADIGKFKVPTLRGLESRSPYFHNGFTDSLDELVDFYNTRFGIKFTPQEHSDLVAFLRTM